jgi:hypothetical protein
MAAGALVLLAQWAITTEITFETTDSAQAVIGVVCVGLAVVYLTRAANDLPRLFPGHDADSEKLPADPRHGRSDGRHRRPRSSVRERPTAPDAPVAHAARRLRNSQHAKAPYGTMTACRQDAGTRRSH